MTSILLIHVNKLGDSLCFLPVIQHAQTRSDLSVDVWTSPEGREVFHPWLGAGAHRTFPAETFFNAPRHPTLWPALLRHSSRKRYDAILIGGDQGNVARLAATAIRSPLKVARDLPSLRTNRLIRDRVSVPDNVHQTELHWQLWRALLTLLHGDPAPPKSPPLPDLSPFVSADIPDTPSGVLIHPGASSPQKRWPLERFQQLALVLAENRKVTWIDPGDLPPPEGIPCVRPHTFPDLVSCTYGHKLFVGNNSGPMHIADIMGLHGVVLNGTANASWSQARHPDRWTFLHGPTDSITPCANPETGIDDVCRAIEQLEAEAPADPSYPIDI